MHCKISNFAFPALVITHNPDPHQVEAQQMACLGLELTSHLAVLLAAILAMLGLQNTSTALREFVQ